MRTRMARQMLWSLFWHIDINSVRMRLTWLSKHLTRWGTLLFIGWSWRIALSLFELSLLIIMKSMYTLIIF